MRAWLFAIATNLSRNHFRSEKPTGRPPGVSVESREADLEGPKPGAVRRGPNARGEHRPEPSSAAPGVHHAQDPRSRLRSDRPKPRLLGRERTGACLSSPAQGPAESQRSRASAPRRRRKAGIACRDQPVRHGATAMTRKARVCLEIEPRHLRGHGRRRALDRAASRASRRLLRRMPRRVPPLSRDRGRRGRAPADAGGGGKRGAGARGSRVEAGGPEIAAGVVPGVPLAAGTHSHRALGARRVARRISARPRRCEGLPARPGRRGRAAGGRRRGRDLYRELLEYLRGDRTRLEWPLDLRLARSDFHRAVLRATAAIPYGAVTSYAGIAAEIGKPAATRAVQFSCAGSLVPSPTVSDAPSAA